MGRIRLFGISRWLCAVALAVVLGASACSLVGNAPGRSEVSDKGAVPGQGGQDRLRLTPLPRPAPADAAAVLKSVPLASVAVTPSKRPPTGGNVDPTLPWLRPDSADRVIQANLTRSAVAPPNRPARAKPAGAVAVHLASYASQAAARSGWGTLRKMYPRALAAADPILADAEAGADGPAVRLLAGPFDSESARSVCRDILTRGGWCRQVPLPR